MSTKIYNGFELQLTEHERADALTALMTRTERFRATILPLAHITLNRWFVRQLYHYFDHEQFFHTLHNAATPQSPYSAAHQDYLKRQTKLRDGVREPEIDMSFEVVDFPYQGHVYGMYYTENRAFNRLWKDQPGITDFHYQDSTDRPEHLSDATWDHRRHVWDSIFDGPFATPAVCGLTSTILPATLDPAFDTFPHTYATFAPSLDTRAREIGYQAALHDLMVPPYTVMEFQRVDRLLRTPEDSPRLTAAIALAREQLIPVPDFEAFFLTPPDRSTPSTSHE